MPIIGRTLTGLLTGASKEMKVFVDNANRVLAQARKDVVPFMVNNNGLAGQSFVSKSDAFDEFVRQYEAIKRTSAPSVNIAFGQDDYYHSGSCFDSRGNEISLAAMADAIAGGSRVFNPGSALTLKGAKENAAGMAAVEGVKDFVVIYTAMDFSQWPVREIGRLMERTVATTIFSQIVAQVVNEAAQRGQTIKEVLHVGHSAGGFTQILSITAFDPDNVRDVLMLEITPLIHPAHMKAIMEAKIGSHGRICIVRPGFDAVEEAVDGGTLFMLDGVHREVAVDIRVNGRSHGSVAILKELKSQFKVNFEHVVENNHSVRWNEVETFHGSDGHIEETVYERRWSQSEWKRDPAIFEKKREEALPGEFDLSGLDIPIQGAHEVESVARRPEGRDPVPPVRQDHGRPRPKPRPFDHEEHREEHRGRE